MSYGDQGVAPIPDPLPQNQQTKIKTGDDQWSDTYALRIVRSDFAYAEAYRTHAHDWRYRNAAELYLAWAGQRYWEGTRVPRSSIGIYVVFEQVESMLPKIVDAICDPESYNFYADKMETAMLWKELVVDQMGESQFREHFRRSAKSSLIYGNGLVEIGMEDYMDENVDIEESRLLKSMQVMNHPIIGPVPIPQIDRNYKRKITSEKKRRPYLRYRSIIDSYVDPNCESTSLQDPTCGYHILRIYMHAEELKKLRGKKNFNIPDDATLANYSKAKTTANQDVTKLSNELFRYNLWNPSQDYSSDPAQKRIEVIEYTTKERKVWLLNREHIAYNQPNQYKEINYYSMCYADVLDRWHALAISDVAEGEQRLQQSITNGRVDELALSIHRPMIKRRGVTIPPYQLKVRPGVVIEVENPEGDIKQLEVQNITQQAFVEVEASERRVQRITGMSDLAALGSPTSGGNSANRTAAGVNTQVGATQDRTRYYISNAENMVVKPILNKFIWMNKRFMDLKQAAAWITLHPQFGFLNPLEVMNARVSADCDGSGKLAAKQGFLNILPLWLQYVMNPETLQLFSQQQGMVLDIKENTDMIMRAINYSPRNPLFRPLSDQEKQAQQQPPQAELIKMQMQQQQLGADRDIHRDQNVVKLVDTYLKQAFAHHGKMAELDDKGKQHGIDTALAVQQMEHEKDMAAMQPAGGGEE